MDKMASEAVRLTNFHQIPMCTASRAALMTGKYAEQQELGGRVWGVH